MKNIITHLDSYRQMAEVQEERHLVKDASLSKNHQRRHKLNEDYRLPYKRDVDCIIHSKAYARYMDKTQVVYLVENAHISYRALHVQLVSNFARGIAQILRLNIDLVEAIALGHDVGHPPFGHEGEVYLSSLSQEYGNGVFAHPWQSCHLFSEIEPLNLGLAVYDGFLCHDGGLCGPVLKPCYGKTWEDHIREKKQKLADPDKNIWPGTLEGCLVKLCDTISYLGRDIEDAISLGILSRDSVPKTVLGTSNQQILNVLAADLIAMSYVKDYIALSDEVYEALCILRRFNFENIYVHPKLKVESKRIQKGYRTLFEILLDDLHKHQENSYIWKSFLHNKGEGYLSSTTPIQKVIDYISGMTNTYFVRTLEKLIIPQRIELA